MICFGRFSHLRQVYLVQSGVRAYPYVYLAAIKVIFFPLPIADSCL